MSTRGTRPRDIEGYERYSLADFYVERRTFVLPVLVAAKLPVLVRSAQQDGMRTNMSEVTSALLAATSAEDPAALCASMYGYQRTIAARSPKKAQGLGIPTLLGDRLEMLVDTASQEGADADLSRFVGATIVSANMDTAYLETLLTDYRKLCVGDFDPAAAEPAISLS